MRIRGDHRLYALAVSIASIELASCGAGVAAVAASAGGSSGGGNAPPALTAFEVLGPKVSPATLRLVVSDPEGDPVQAELFFAAGGNPEAPLSALEGVTGNQVVLPSSGAGTETLLDWDFEAELGGRGFVPALDLVVRQRGGAAISGGAIRVSLGNDPPVVASVVPVPSDPENPAESSGIVEVRLVVGDSSSDIVSLALEWQPVGPPADDWRPATAAGVFPEGVETDPDGVELSFFWNTNVDLRDGDQEVLLQATPDDRTTGALGVGEPRESASFHVDNNAEPILQLLTELLVTSPDERRGIPVSFRVTDEEGDLVEVVFQWRRPEESFPWLPADGAQLDSILEDPALRREYHICTAYPRYGRGLVVPEDETTVRLPELAESQSWILAWELQGRTLELLRRSSLPEPISPTWPANPMVAPIAALPLGDGLTAVVVDGVGSPRVREIELATGRVVREVVELGPGMPTAAALERGGAAVLVASNLGGIWRIERVELATSVVTLSFVSDDNTSQSPVRGIASLGRNAALVTVESTLWQLDYRDPLATKLVTLIDGLATPWGVVLDPLREGHVYVAERDALVDGGRAGRILAVDLDSHGKVPVAVKQGLVELEHPEAIALARDGAQILALTNPLGAKQLVGLDLGGRGRNVPFALGAPIVGEAACVASGADGLVVVALPGASELLVGGGVEQRRSIVTPVLPAQRLSVDAPFAPVPSTGQPWRIALASRLRATPQGVERSFAWDASKDLPCGGSAILRAFARDSEAGLVVEGRVPKSVRVPLEVTPITIDNFGGINDLTAADLDRDGDLDLVAAFPQAAALAVYLQTDPPNFSPLSFASPLSLGNPSTTLNPTSVEAGDLDGDGDLDLVSANGRLNGGTLDAYFQDALGTFNPVPLVLSSPDMRFPDCVRACDLDQDGDLDLVSANRFSLNLTIYLQTASRAFAPSPIALEGLPGTGDQQQCVTTADLDGDGDVDLAAGGKLFFQRAPAMFDPPVELLSSSTAPILAADLDEDGDLDLVGGSRILYQDASGEFVSSLMPALSSDASQAADVDGDGDLDLVTGTGIFFQEVTGEFDPRPLARGGLDVADVDGDGHLDLIGALSILLQSRRGSLDGGALSVPTPGSFVTTADFDTDGDFDVATTSSVLFQSSPGVFDPDPLVIDVSPQSSLQTAADLDGDGDLDLASSDGLNDDLKVFFQDGPGRFDLVPLVLDVPGGSSPSLSDPSFVTATDLDGDGDLDLASANVGSDDLTLFFQRAPRSFDLVPFVVGVPGGAAGPAQGSNPSWIAAGDLDSDGDVDLASANAPGFSASPSDPEVTIFFQSTTGGLDPMPLGLDVSGNGSGGGFSITAADLDADGDLDLASANVGTVLGGQLELGNISVFFQAAPGVFDMTPLFLDSSVPQFPSEPLHIASSDVDADGDVDLVSANWGGFGGNLAVFFQRDQGIFDTPPLARFTRCCVFRVERIAAGDIDGDGDVDLATGHFHVLQPDARELFIFWGGR